MKAGLMSFMPSDRHNIGKRGGEATHENDGDTVCIDEQVVVHPKIAFAKDGHFIPQVINGSVVKMRHTREKTFGGRVGRRKDFGSTVGETLSMSMSMSMLMPESPLAAFDPSRHKIVEAKKYEQDMADLSLFREKMGQMIEDELAALSDFEDFDETPAVHMSLCADGIFRPSAEGMKCGGG